MGEKPAKLEKILRLINEKGLDGLIIYSAGTCSILRASYLYYFSGCRPFGPRNAAVLTKSGGTTLLVEPAWAWSHTREKSWVSDVRGSDSFVDDLVGLIRSYGLRTVGVAMGREMTEDVYSALEAASRLEEADAIMEAVAAEKSPEEIEGFYDTARIADVGFNAFLEESRPGLREYELVAELEYRMRQAGADDVFVLMSSGPHNYEMHEPADRRLCEGDLIIGEITPVQDGRFIQLCRTVALGEPAPIVHEKYEMLMRALEESVRAVKPNLPGSVMSKAMNKVIGDAGYAKYCYPPYMRARGHGFGVGSVAPGAAIDDETKALFAPGQAVVIHPNQYIPETGYLACGETYMVTDRGAEPLARTETKLYVKEVC